MDDISAKLCCYVCDNATDLETSGKLLCKVTDTSRVSFPKVISTLISNEFVLIVDKEDVICRQCTDIVNRLDQLQHQVSLVRKILSEFLSKKYQVPINDSYEEGVEGTANIILDPHSSSFCDEVNSDLIVPRDKSSTIKDFECSPSKKSLNWEVRNENAGNEFNVNFEPENSVDKNSNSVDVASSTLTSELDSDMCFDSVKSNEIVTFSLDGKKDSEEISTTYLVCDRCHALMKTADDISTHICQEQQLDLNKKFCIKEIVSVDDDNQDKAVGETIEVAVVESLLERELTKPKKDVKLNLCCFICEAILPSRSDLALHVLSHYPVKRSKKKGTVCPVCDTSYTSLIDFMNHYDMHVDASGNKRKSKESAIFSSKEKNLSEKETSTSECLMANGESADFACPFCDKKSGSSMELNEHLKSKHNINTCYHCKKEFPSDLKLKEHLVLHEAKVKPNQCYYCLIRFKTSAELESHVETVHDQIKITKSCPLCRKKCGSNFSVKTHVLKCHYIPVLQQEIREKYSHGSDLVDDMKSLGASEKMIKSIMDTHKPPVIDGGKNSKIIINVEASDVSFCLLCGFSSKSMPNLDRHREKHSAKRIPCPLCEYMSCDSDELTVHLSDCHNMPLTENCCPHCLSETEEDIILHMKALHGKFYTHLTCFVCKEMFFSKENLKDHFSMTHLITEQRFFEKGDYLEMDDNSVEVDDPLDNTTRDSNDETMNHELTAALESIIPSSPSQIETEERIENREDLIAHHIDTEQISEALAFLEKSDNQESEILEPLPKGFTCSICRKECTSPEDLAVHIGKHSRKERVSCSFCTSVLYDTECLNQHIIKDHTQNINKYCFPCKKSFSSKFTLVKHLSLKCCNRICVICNKQFKKISPYIQHLSYSHRKDLTCSHCNKLCRSVKHLNYHETLHDRYKGKVFKCDECGKTFLTPSTLKSHSISHTGKYQYVCEFCGRGFLSSYGLNEHRASHTGDIRYCCEICGKSFRLYDTYHRHRRQHDNPFPSECSECGSKFRNASRVAEHKRKVHTGERPYACPYCPMAFNVTSSYHIHLCKHTKVYPYNCEICKRGFASRFKYANHLAARHNDHSFGAPTPEANVNVEKLEGTLK